MSNFITNSGKANLKKRLTELSQKGDELKFLVGFFYFSGINELYEGLKKNPHVKIKVLVGLNIDKSIFGLHEIAHKVDLSDNEKVYKFFESVKKSLNSEDFDTKEFYEQVKFFIKLIKDNKLTIRKTYEPNHAKLYIFKLEKEQIGRSKMFITGSSNLTKAGLSTQQEFNVEISDFGFENAEEYFDTLWDEAVKITEDDTIKTKLINVIEKETLIKDVSPFEAFVLLLKTFLDSYEQKEIGDSLIKTLVENGYTPYEYQLDAVRQALSVIEKNNGVILADVVGLGKTIIACCIAKTLRKRGLVICSPGLVGDKNKTYGWSKYTEEFGLYDWEVRSWGDLETGKLSEFVSRAKDIEVIIIDEAHRFRNQDTEDYESLKNICRDKTIIMLTATPFNNRPGDILSLLKLFITPKKSTITLENNLVDRFKTFKGMFDKLGYILKYHSSSDDLKRKKAETYYEIIFGEKGINLDKIKQRARYLAKQIRDVIEPVTIRRNRLDLLNNPYYKDEVKHLSKLDDPQEWFFELTKQQSEYYDKIISLYFGDPDDGGLFKGAIYRPFEYEVRREKIDNDKLTLDENRQYQQQRNLYDFMRRLLVKRFESSFGSFEQSIKNFKQATKNALTFISKPPHKYILDRSLLEKIYQLDEEEIEKYLAEFQEKLSTGNYPKNNRVYSLDKFAYRDEFLADIKSDLTLFQDILDELSKLDLVHNDPKSDCLVLRIKDELSKKPGKDEPKRKIIIFSEYTDTINHLKTILEKQFGKRMLVVAGDLPTQKILEINKNFDAAEEKQDNDFDILLSTDRISEGFNLNRAGMVVNYDIPWNPVRVIQRVGRINRISKKVYDKLYIVNFFPTEKGSELVKSREIASNKMFLIHNTLGEDAKIFDIDEEPTPAGLFERVQRNPDKLEKESFYTKVLNTYLEIKRKHPQLIEELKNYPPRIKVAKKFPEDELLVFLKKGRLYVYLAKYGSDNELVRESTFEEVFDQVACTKNETPRSLNDSFWEYYEQIKNYKSHINPSVSEQSLEQKALNNLKSLIDKPWDALIPYLDFLRTLREDILDFGTLSDYTLRRISNLENSNDDKQRKTILEIVKLKSELGEDYLEKEKLRQKDLKKEIIVAIENQKP
ncbi:helicase [Candidatus Gottesmanbacteria bacterium RIFCSPHIGHO2_02_FULL_40_13]|uniref:Helicase n=1 Tax=Candidatus Gottesmanbacteria bacterium RIFCSPHIGHO2_02_FULL_40_13 TaxID=1798384 RepID=A0A1F6A7R3_9BACT|nr:MAG: helicase [Candidatus Gottesmanbacteria bacterium RIFCSPHIGHO2_02_FULL_40_13]